MYEYGSNCEYEHAVHSFILDVDDPCLLKPEGTFTHEQMEIIRSYCYSGLPYLSDSLKAMFNLCSETVAQAIDEYNERTVAGVEGASRTDVAKEEWVLRCLTAKVRECGNFDPYEQCDEEWLQSVLLDFFRMYRWDVLSWVSTVGSEADLVSRVWSRLDECFYSLHMQTRRDHTSIAAAAGINRDKTLTGMAPINAQQPPFRPDLLLFKNNIEFGTAECGKDNDNNGISQKELVETQLHCPKLLKSMLLQVAAKYNNRKSAVRKLKTIGFAQFHLHMSVMVMDFPSGSVCRLSRTPSYRIATTPSLIQSGLLPILKLTLKCKEVVGKTIGVVESAMRTDDEEPDLRSAMTKNDTVELPPVARFKEKKSKTSA